MFVPGANRVELTGRQLRRLHLARENGYLNATCSDSGSLLSAYARWCWRLRLPMVWTERLSPHSRYGRVRLDLFTTPYRLTAEAQAELQELGPGAAISPHEARWERVALPDLDSLAATVLRAVIRGRNLQAIRDYPVEFPSFSTSRARNAA